MLIHIKILKYVFGKENFQVIFFKTALTLISNLTKITQGKKFRSNL